MKNKRGFTLSEVLAVITILGIIILIAVPSISNLREEINKRKVKSDAQMFVALTKEYIEANPNVETNTITVKLSDIDMSKLNGNNYNENDTWNKVTATGCALSGIRYKCSSYSVQLRDDIYKATGTTSITVVRR